MKDSKVIANGGTDTSENGKGIYMDSKAKNFQSSTATPGEAKVTVDADCIVKADGNATPTTVTAHTAETNLASAAAAQYTVIAPAYAITNATPAANAETNNGSIAVDTFACEGDTVTVTVTPAEGYALDTLSCNDGTTDTEITATAGVYFFTMPAKAVTVTATFKEATLITIDAQTGTLTYGTEASATYGVTYTRFTASSPSVTWTAESAPAGVTTAFSGTNNGTLTITTTSATPAGEYEFKVTAKNGEADVTSAEAVLTVSPKAINVTADNKDSTIGAELVKLTYTVDTATPLVGQDTLNGELATEANKAVVDTYAITQGTLNDTNNPNYTITFTSGTYTVAEKPSCIRVINKELEAGEQILALDGVAVGIYTLTESEDGWTVQNAEGKYLTFNETDKTVSLTETPTVWSYNGGLYIPVQEVQSWHWWWKIVKETDYYLALDADNLVTTLVYTFATVQETEVHDEHDYIYTNNYDETHDALCRHCGEKIEGEAHTYVEGKCICGVCNPTGLTVEVEVTSSTLKILWWKKTTNTAKIITNVPDVLIQYRASENDTWSSGAIYTSSKDIDTLYFLKTPSHVTASRFVYPSRILKTESVMDFLPEKHHFTFHGVAYLSPKPTRR